jgi:hypothetical protein
VGHIHEGLGKNGVARGALKKQTIRKREIGGLQSATAA